MSMLSGYDEYICYALKYDEEKDVVMINEFDADCMPSHAAVSDWDECVSRSKDTLIKIAHFLHPNKKIEFYSIDEELIIL